MATIRNMQELMQAISDGRRIGELSGEIAFALSKKSYEMLLRKGYIDQDEYREHCGSGGAASAGARSHVGRKMLWAMGRRSLTTHTRPNGKRVTNVNGVHDEFEDSLAKRVPSRNQVLVEVKDCSDPDGKSETMIFTEGDVSTHESDAGSYEWLRQYLIDRDAAEAFIAEEEEDSKPSAGSKRDFDVMMEIQKKRRRSTGGGSYELKGGDFLDLTSDTEDSTHQRCRCLPSNVC